jgi:hypothetical protein
VTARFTNRDTCLDSRETGIPSLYAVLIFIHAFIAMVFIVNQILFPHFIVPIHACFSLCSVLKTVSCYVFAKLWQWKSLHDEFPMESAFVAEGIYVVAHTLLFTFNGLAIMGWGTYRENMPAAEAINIFMVSAWFFVIQSFKDYANRGAVSLGVWFLSLNGCAIYVYMMFSSIMAAVKMEDLFWRSRDMVMLRKLGMALDFGGYAVVWMCCVFFACAYFMATPSWSFLEKLVCEGFLLALSIIDLAVFMYRERHRDWRDETEVWEPEVEPVEEEQTMMYVVEPDENYFAYMSRPEFGVVL